MEKSKPIRLTGNFVEATTDKNEMLDVFNEETKHTSGKWEIGKIKTHDGLAYHFEVFVNNGIGGKHIISESVLDEDDANLIASAPEMLEFLQRLDYEMFFNHNTKQWKIKMLELINKAKGE